MNFYLRVKPGIACRAILITLQALSILTAASFATAQEKAVPLAIGESFSIASKILKEKRIINVYMPPGYKAGSPLPVLYMPDGGIEEDFLHVVGLVQVSVGNGTMRPFLLVGIENTERRRDMTGPTTNPKDKAIAPRVGGSASFRLFIKEELMPEVKRRYVVTSETAIVGESLAGLFVVETMLLEPSLFDTYIAFDPSLWWNDGSIFAEAEKKLLGSASVKNKTFYFASSGDDVVPGTAKRLADILFKTSPNGFNWHFQPMPDEKHSTIYHPAALKAFRFVFKPVKREQ